jgi:hypothetical protein
MTGKFNSLMRLDEITAPDGSLMKERPRTLKLFGVPGFMYREFVSEGFGWLRQSIFGDHSSKLRHENRLCYLAGYMSKRYEMLLR